MGHGFFGEEMSREWVSKTNVSKDEAPKILKEYIKKYGEGNVLLGNEAVDFNKNPLPDCNVIYVHKRALKHL